jgi:hypothetical protein
VNDEHEGGEEAEDGGGPVGHPSCYVWYNDGTEVGQEDGIYALVTAQDEGFTQLNLLACPASGAPYPVNGVPRREKPYADGDTGGDTWRLVR